MFVPTGNTSKESVAEFEQEIGFSLPDDYREFLINQNGGVCQEVVIKLHRPGDILIDCLFGISKQNELNLRFWLQEFKGEIPEKSLIIGSDAGGGFLLLCVDASLAGVYYYDHSYLFETSSDEENSYLIYPTFSDLFSDVIGLARGS